MTGQHNEFSRKRTYNRRIPKLESLLGRDRNAVNMINNKSFFKLVFFLVCFLLIGFLVSAIRAQNSNRTSSAAANANSNGEWQFAVSGDSRNCGDIVMPTIAQDISSRTRAQFYWHLGDLRAISNFDEDISQRADARPMTILEYENTIWQDFIQNQANAFTVPFFLGIGNHEAISPKSRADFIIQFADWLDAPVLKEQRLKDDPNDHRLKTYFHWIQNGVDFIYLDNATTDQFDAAQMIWFNKVVNKAEADPSVTTIVVGMHEALPDSLSAFHSMSDYPNGVVSGRAVYQRLLEAQNRGHKLVYVLASHSHFYMDGIFDSDYWKANGGVLPGWIIGTAGAVRYALPKEANKARAAKTNVYGYLLATVNPAGSPAGTIRFDFRELKEKDTPNSITSRYGENLVHQCFEKNTQVP